MQERRFSVMGTEAHVAVVGGRAGQADDAVRRLHDLERRWSRFLAQSELSRLNAASGAPCLVSGDTLLLVDLLRRAWETTNGRFDPTMHDAIAGLGYARSWPDACAPVELPASAAAPGCAGIWIDRDARLVRVPRGVHLDPGGLGKGLAADLLVGELLEAGAAGGLVNVGGDLRVGGESPTGADWLVRVEHPADRARSVAAVAIADGGVATTSRMRRRWSAGDRELHHVLDPSTALPADREWAAVTVVAGTAWWAEALAKVAFLDGSLDRQHAAALFVYEDGAVRLDGDRPDRWFRVLQGAVR